MLARRHFPGWFKVLPVFCMGVYAAIVLSMLSFAATALGATAGGDVDFNRDIRPILSENCFKCHGPGEEDRKAKLRFDLRDAAIKPAKSGNVAIVPGAPEKS